jgi:hypothetical protein
MSLKLLLTVFARCHSFRSFGIIKRLGFFGR